MDLHVRTATSLHQSFPWLHPTQVKFTIFRVLTAVLILKPITMDQGRSLLPLAGRNDHFHFAREFSIHTLAHTLDSLVRVSRRDKYHRW